MRESKSQMRAETLIDALPFLQKARGQTLVIKYGGSALENPQQVDRLLRDIVFLETVGLNPVLLHGGGKAISEKMRNAGTAPEFVDGLRVTDAATIQLVEEALDTDINPEIVAKFQSLGGKAAGISGKSVFVSAKKEPQKSASGTLVDYGFVGDVTKIITKKVQALIRAETVPVISPLGATPEGETLNINADVAAAALAIGLNAHKLIFVSDVPGIMRDASDPNSLIPSVTRENIRSLIKTKIISGGMLPKVDSAVRALGKGVGSVHFIGGHIPHGLLQGMLTSAGVGTEILA